MPAPAARLTAPDPSERPWGQIFNLSSRAPSLPYPCEPTDVYATGTPYPPARAPATLMGVPGCGFALAPGPLDRAHDFGFLGPVQFRETPSPGAVMDTISSNILPPRSPPDPRHRSLFSYENSFPLRLFSAQSLATVTTLRVLMAQCSRQSNPDSLITTILSHLKV